MRIGNISENVREHIADFRDQLDSWGFMALEVPGISARIKELYAEFSAALASVSPTLDDYTADKTPQASSGGNHGFFKYGSEVPRLANGIADPKEFFHVSGAMLDDCPAGSGAVLSAFPALASQSRFLFETGFSIAQVIGDLVRDLLPGDPPKLGLSASSSILRMIRYRDSGDREVLAHEHSGIQMLGVQFPPSDAGLQYVLNDGSWVEPVIQDTDVLLCNIGRMLAEASGQRFRPSTHRVHRSAMSHSPVRWSSVLFVHPNHDNLQWRISDGNVQHLQETWGQFVSHGLHALGLTE